MRRVGLGAVMALCAVVTLPAQARAAEGPGPYAYEPSAKPVKGAPISTGAERLEPGGTYRDSIGPGDKLFYRLELDAKSNAYVSATACRGRARRSRTPTSSR